MEALYRKELLSDGGETGFDSSKERTRRRIGGLTREMRKGTRR